MRFEGGERKSIQTDRVILIPGPKKEITTVRNIFDLFTVGLKSPETSLGFSTNAVSALTWDELGLETRFISSLSTLNTSAPTFLTAYRARLVNSGERIQPRCGYEETVPSKRSFPSQSSSGLRRLSNRGPSKC